MSYLNQKQLRDFSVVELEAVERRLREVVASHPLVEEKARYILALGGKRIRPLLVLLCSDIYRAPYSTRIEIATATELLHTASLLHDDVIDQAPLRRGQATVNVRWGNAASVLAGDFLFARAFKILSPYREVLRVMSTAISSMCQGELVQLETHHNTRISPEIYVETIACKTASLLAASCEAGGIISSMPTGLVSKLHRFGLHLGIAYQIIDDICDFTLDKGQSGKLQGCDLLNGIITLPVIYWLADPSDRARAEKLLASGDISLLAPELAASGAIQKAADAACRHIDKGLALLASLPRCPATTKLTRLAESFRHRAAGLTL